MSRADAARVAAPLIVALIEDAKERTTVADAVVASRVDAPVVGSVRGDFSGEAA
jgi:hypothetical protein